MKKPLHTRPQSGVGGTLQPLAFSGAGFVPDVMSDHGITTLPAANRSTLEDGIPYGKDGMLAAPGSVAKLNPARGIEGGTGGAGSFNTSIAMRKEQR